MGALTKANSNRMAYVGSRPNDAVRDSDSWYTPPTYVEAAREVMGGIDLDPFSSSEANKHIRAKWFFSVHRSAHENAWMTPARRKKYKSGLKVWMNPPYSAPDISKSIYLLVERYEAGDVEQAVVLTNNGTDTRWFAQLWKISSAICFTDHRISFLCSDGKRLSGNTRGQTFFYIGSNAVQGREKHFISRFAQFGHVTTTEIT